MVIVIQRAIEPDFELNTTTINTNYTIKHISKIVYKRISQFRDIKFEAIWDI